MYRGDLQDLVLAMAGAFFAGLVTGVYVCARASRWSGLERRKPASSVEFLAHVETVQPGTGVVRLGRRASDQLIKDMTPRVARAIADHWAQVARELEEG